MPRKYEMAMELLEETEISGIKIAQPLYHPMMDRRMQYIMPSQISIQVSTDGGHWQNVTYFETNELGQRIGRSYFVEIPGRFPAGTLYQVYLTGWFRPGWKLCDRFGGYSSL